jgi:hypothetical protein
MTHEILANISGPAQLDTSAHKQKARKLKVPQWALLSRPKQEWPMTPLCAAGGLLNHKRPT